jgi:predicted small metal-binding protein
MTQAEARTEEPIVPKDLEEKLAEALQAPERPQPAPGVETYSTPPAETANAKDLEEVRGRLSAHAEGPHGDSEQVETPEGSVPQEAIDRAKKEIRYLNESYTDKAAFVQDMEESIEVEDEFLKDRSNMAGAGTFVTGAAAGMAGGAFLGLSAPVTLIGLPALAAVGGIGVWAYKRIQIWRKIHHLRDVAAQAANSF